MSVTQAAVFDLGNVLVRIDPDPALRAMAELVGADEPSFRQAFAAIEEPFETGRMSEEQALEALFAAGRSADRRDVADGTFDRRRALRLLRATFPARFTPVGPAIDIAYRLAEAGTIVALASNTSPLDFREVRRRYPDVIQPFGDRLFLSYRIGAMKPDAAFYRAILDSLGVSADECVFIDDKRENVAGAEAVGMRGLLFESAEDMDARL